MPKFTDEEKRDWKVRVDVFTIANVREIDTDKVIDLGSLEHMADNFTRMAADPCLLCAVLFVVCEEEAKERGLDYVKFSKLILGDVMEEANLALEEAIINFSRPKSRSLMRRLQKKINRVEEMGQNLVAEKLEDQGLEDRILAKMKATMEDLTNDSLTPSSSASTSPDKPE